MYGNLGKIVFHIQASFSMGFSQLTKSLVSILLQSFFIWINSGRHLSVGNESSFPMSKWKKQHPADWFSDKGIGFSIHLNGLSSFEG